MFGKWFTSFDLFTQIILACPYAKSKQQLPRCPGKTAAFLRRRCIGGISIG
jgi:hypothetical protein